ncbi:PEP-CTERM sorting domain-containing protein [Nostoc sp. FACHB-888]|uniref:PEP-CTERM sorting domain-containing protein n=1 Tax=Nostoc sp. FACHB-888 TaxID=2692842 RepID=UPI001683FCA2|nr:PEP-CTERM sorting domain-containing protein [Nostoc sp. FACHB-888]MBD2246195.1 PEP-CTERM sorting domain-containing protein [Nostoc sp. FACHB-888]
MISLKSKLINATLAATFAIPLATSGMFASAGSAQAAIIGSASFTGLLNFENELVDNPNSEKLKFTNPALFVLDDSGIFDNTTSVTVGSGNPYSLLLEKLNDISTTSGNTSASYKAVLASITDPFFTFSNSVNQIKFKATNIGNITRRRDLDSSTGVTTTSIDTFSISGTFYNGVNAIGNGTINAQKQNIPYSPGFYTFIVNAQSVPEPTTLLGLGAVGAVMAMSRRRKTLAN